MGQGPVKQGFKKLIAWQRGYELVLSVYKATRKFPREELYGLTSQLQRAAVSVPANISEGYERNHRKEYIQFLHISKGSLGEMETLLMLARDLGYLEDGTYEDIDSQRSEVARLLQGLISSLA